MNPKSPLFLFLAAGVLLICSQVYAQQSTTFTYQGQLRDNGTNANGAYTMMFKLYDSDTGGNQIGAGITSSPTLVNGLFTVNLDFGGGAFNGNARWLGITVSNGVAQALWPRVQVLPSPYAQFAAVAATVTNGAIMNAQLAGNAVATANIQNGAITTAQIATGAVTNRNLTANAVNATNIAGGQVVKTINGLNDSVTLSPGANMSLFTNGNSLQFSSVVPNVQAFWMSTNQFVVPANVTRIMVEVWGPGGGSGLGYPSTSDTNGGGGGAGGYAMNVFTVTPGANYTVTTPAGSAHGVNGLIASFGNLISASGGLSGGAATVSGPGNGGTGGMGSGGLVNMQGGTGQKGGMGGSVWRGGDGRNGGPGEGGAAGIGGSAGVIVVYY